MDYPPHVDLMRRLLALASERTCQMLDRPFRLPSAIYCAPERLELEHTHLFRKLPLVLGHASQLPAPGDVLTLDLLGVPLIVARGRDGELHGLINACRHRGVRLLDAPDVAHRPSFVCPYHNWTYGLDGALRHVTCPEAFPGLDPTARSLVRVPLKVHQGLVFAVLDARADADALRPEAYLEGLAGDLAQYDLADHHVFARTLTRRRTNWKLLIDAFLESYHVVRLHRGTVGKFFLDNVGILDRVGPHARSAVARVESAEAVALPPEAWNGRRHAIFSYFLFPNTILVMHPDYVSILSIFPETADESTFHHVMLTPHVPRDDRERDHWRRSFELVEAGVYQGEDLWVCEQIQRTLRSGANDTFQLGRLEVGVRFFHESLEHHLGVPSILDDP